MSCMEILRQSPFSFTQAPFSFYNQTSSQVA
jgi:hypothetical protein